MTLRLEINNVLEWLHPSSWPWHLWLNITLWSSTLIRLTNLRVQGIRFASWYIFLVASVLTLLTTYHLYYDAVLLLPLVAFGMRLPQWLQWQLIVLLLPLLLPLNGIALALGNPVALHFVYFLMPISLLGILMVLLAAPVQETAEPSC